MSDDRQLSGSSSMPPPAKVLVGLFQIAFGFLTGVFGAGLKVFPITTAIGSPLLKLAYKLSYDGGANFVRGTAGTFGLIGKALNSKAQSESDYAQAASQDKLTPPVR